MIDSDGIVRVLPYDRLPSRLSLYEAAGYAGKLAQWERRVYFVVRNPDDPMSYCVLDMDDLNTVQAHDYVELVICIPEHWGR